MSGINNLNKRWNQCPDTSLEQLATDMDSRDQHQQQKTGSPATPKSRSGQSTPMQQHQQQKQRPLNVDLPRDNEYEA